MRRFVRASLVSAALAAPLFTAGTAAADLVETSAGVKAMAGGSLWNTPSDRPGNDTYEGIGFAGNAGGFSYGAGLYLEARFIKFLSLELDLIYDKSTLLRNVEYNNVLDVQEKIVMTNWRIPMLLKVNLPTPFGRLFVLAGPELVRTSSVDASVEAKDDVNAATQAELDRALTARDTNYTMITGGLGLTIDLIKFEIPLELRASKSFDHPSDYNDRVETSATPPYFDVEAQTSWDFRVSAGFGYRF